jgi:hypothetical protein
MESSVTAAAAAIVVVMCTRALANVVETALRN